MGVRKVLLDTNILIDYLAGIAQARVEVERHAVPAISVITWIEVMAGATPDNEQTHRDFLSTFMVLPLTTEVAERSSQIRRHRTPKLKLPDTIILATAQLENLLLVTRNSRDFSKKDRDIRIPYKLLAPSL
jgi:predicted nucleic acid-binding protein